MNYLDLRYIAANKFNVVTFKVADDSPIGACCGSTWLEKDTKDAKHYGIVVSPADVNVSFKLRKAAYITDTIVTKNGTFNVSVRTKK